ncbi:DUF748 domain-containing protein [Caballeronia sp. SEWSISQ10-4 2]|uniref:DUF748 domain-containing protein n=1 Tax=Caballeronia sp. SEWSISQ10-4 2 TaxID=2937438 RepID=UPI00265080AF|nr:DUF748 domain-containing protein [Caballeronia sp. SEWSISQ10-4 2]MDN7183968.1 DUF748 domain-containing protein [Caballeronia sp. SEWSISQ10-4 2]
MASLNKTSLTSAGRSLIKGANSVAQARRTRRVVIGLLLAVIVIGLLGFFAAPPLIRHIAEQQLSAQLDRPASIERIALNPYTLSFEADRVHIGEAQANLSAGTKNGDFVDIERLIVHPSWSSLFRLAPVINEVKIDSPRFHIVRLDAQRFNFSDLIEKFSKPSANPSSKPARFSVSNIRVENGRIDFDDRLLKTQHVIDRWSIGIPFIANLPSTTELFVTPSLQARIDGSPLSITGRTKPFSESRESEIAVQLDGLDVPQMLSYAPASLPVAVKSGRLTTNLDVSFALAAAAPVVRIKGTADLTDLAVTDKQDTPLFAAQTLHVNAVNLEPLRNVYRLDEVRLTQPDVKLSRDKTGAFNFEKLSAATPAPAPASDAKPAASADAPAQPLDLAIRHLAIEQGHIVFDDRLMAQPATLGLTNLNVTLDDFATLGKPPARYTLKTAFDHGGGLDASGGFTLPGKNADAKLALTNLPLAPLQPYVANAVAARITDGSLGANLPLQVDWSKPEPSIQVGAGDVTLKSLKLVPKSNTAPITLGSAQAKIQKIDVAGHTAALDSVVLNGLSIDAKRLKDGSIDLAALAGPHETAPEASATRKVEKANAAGPAWRYQIAQVSLNDSSADFTDESMARPVKLHIAPLQLGVKQVTDDLTKPLPVEGKLTMNGKGALAVAGTLTAKPLSLALHVDASALDAAAFEPYFGGNLNATVSSALLTANGDASFSGEGRTLKAGYKGDVSLSNVRLIDKVNSEPLAGWNLLGLTKLNARYDEKGADVDAARVTFANFYGRVLLDPQGKLNLRDIVVQDKTPATKQAAAPTAASAPTAPTPVPVAPKTASSSANLRFGQLVLQNGRVTYTDNFVKPNFTANLVAITGTIGAFGTHSTTPAPVDVAAKLSANGPVSIKGVVNPLIAKPSLDLTASAHDVELPNISPYSTKYAGYPITKGKLNVDLHYTLANDQLSANNHLFIDQLTFGDHVDNTTATKLPVRLAVSLLKNSRGEIDVNIPISGSLSNPEFSIGSLVWTAILHLVERAVTAPFSLLANAFGGKNPEELGYAEFDPGSATLSDAAKEKLDTIAKALADKPSVTLEISARVDPALDGPGLRTAYVDRQVRLAKMQDASEDNPNINPSTIPISDAEYSKFLTKAYKNADFKKPRNLIGLTKSMPDADMKAALAEHAPVDEGALGTLAQRRASAVKQYFEGKIDSKRIFIVAPHLNADGIKDKGAPTRVDFGLK